MFTIRNCQGAPRRAGARSRLAGGFTLVELLVVTATIAALISMVLPSLAHARRTAVRTRCLASIRQIAIAQVAYAVDQEDRLIAAGDGTDQGSWLGPLQKYGATPQVRKCPADRSMYFAQPIPGTSPPRRRTTSFGLNNYVSPTHAPFGIKPLTRLTQIRRSAAVIQLAELAESGTYAGSDHVHVQDFYLTVAPQITIALINKQMPLGRHGGKPESWEAVLNFGFLDGHAESAAIRQVYTNPTVNRFNPSPTQ
jgi:prepilin-type processing-associated H-X9-DG protein